MPVFMKPGSPFLFDQETGDIVGVKDSDGGEQFFPTSAEVAAHAAAIAAVEGRFPPASGHAQRLLNKIRNGEANATMIVFGDSTGDQSSEWVYLFAQWIGQQYPALTVVYRYWSGSYYNPSDTIQSGGGPTTLTIYNCSYGGSKPDYLIGSLWYGAVRVLQSIDLAIVCYGHNLADDAQENLPMRWLELTEPFLMDHPDSGVIVIAQNPNRLDASNDKKAAAVRDLCAIRRFGLADVWSRYVALGKAETLYAASDAVHPSTGLGTEQSPTGSRLFLEAVTEHFSGAAVAPETVVSLLAQNYGKNLLVNGNFADYPTSPGAPTGWTANNVTATKDTSVKFGENGYSVKLVGTGTLIPNIQQDLTAAQREALLGKWAVMAVAVYVPAAETSNGGRLGLTTNTKTVNFTPVSSTGRDAFVWRFLPLKVGATDTYIRAQLFANAANGSTGTAYFGAAIIRTGRLPSVGEF